MLEKKTWLLVYKLIWNYFFLLSFALKVKRIRSVKKCLMEREVEFFRVKRSDIYARRVPNCQRIGGRGEHFCSHGECPKED